MWCENLTCVSDVIWGQCGVSAPRSSLTYHDSFFAPCSLTFGAKMTRRKVRVPCLGSGAAALVASMFQMRSLSMPHATIWYSIFSCGVEGIQKRSNNVKREVAKARPWSPTSAVRLQWPPLPESYFPATWGLVRHRTLCSRGRPTCLVLKFSS